MVKRCAILGLLMWLNFALVAANFRYLAVKNWPGTLLTDCAIALGGWTLFKAVQGADSWQERVAYCVGAVCGSATALLLT